MKSGPTKKQPPSVLRRRRKALVRQLPPLELVLRGSIIERYKPCGNPGCRCAQGRGHGPKYYLSVSVPGERPSMLYISLAQYEEVAQAVETFRRVREGMEEICRINRELVSRKERL